MLWHFFLGKQAPTQKYNKLLIW